jgi:hypothetical protein
MEETQKAKGHLRRARLIWLFMIAEIIVIIGFASIFSEETPVSDDGAILFTWILMVIMLVDIGMQLLFYNLFSSKGTVQSALGGSILIETMAVAIAIYGMLCMVLNTPLKQTGLLAGLILSFLAMGLAWILTTNLFSPFEFEDSKPVE